MAVMMKEFKLSISSRTENINRIEGFVEEVCHELQLPEDLFGNILIALTEAVNNGIIHGNELEPTKLVNITAKFDGKSMKITVQDEGEGFDFEALPDPTAPENLEKLSGRGVFLMKQLSDGVAYKNDGNTVEITFNVN